MAPLWSEGTAPCADDGFLDSPSCFADSPWSSNRESAPTALPSSGGSEATDSSFEGRDPPALQTRGPVGQTLSNDHCLRASMAHRDSPTQRVGWPLFSMCPDDPTLGKLQYGPDSVGKQPIQGYVPVIVLAAPVPWPCVGENIPPSGPGEVLAAATSPAWPVLGGW